MKAIYNANITPRGIKEIVNEPSDNYNIKNLLVTDNELLYKKSSLTKSVHDLKDNPMVLLYHCFQTEANGNAFYIVVRELKTGDKILWSIVDHIK